MALTEERLGIASLVGVPFSHLLTCLKVNTMLVKRCLKGDRHLPFGWVLMHFFEAGDNINVSLIILVSPIIPSATGCEKEWIYLDLFRCRTIWMGRFSERLSRTREQPFSRRKIQLPSVIFNICHECFIDLIQVTAGLCHIRMHRSMS